MSVRRWFAVRKRERVLGSWPILPGSEKPPAGWPGWPDGKQFAFVITHDIEGPDGLAKCRQLMELEMKLGFRSSFNFIPEGDYAVPRDLIDELKSNGFEVGVHDLHHDGKLYHSRVEFTRHATRINHYLKEWGAIGFRSGFMLRNLEWLHDLDVAYDASTFDTDPFEPQPDGVGTIFPFWVERVRSAECGVRNNNRPHPGPLPQERVTPTLNSQLSTLNNPRSGYVELPYTLPQDSTLFLLFRERHPDIWFQKLDWIARQGGMALIPVHPDYLNFNPITVNGCDYPAGHYKDFLEYIAQKYKGQFWQALPREVARYWTKPETWNGSGSPSAAKGKHTVMGY